MERVILIKNPDSLYFSLRFEANNPQKKIFCLGCPLSRNACSLLDSSVANRIVGRIDLNDPRVAELSGQNLTPNCGDIKQYLLK